MKNYIKDKLQKLNFSYLTPIQEEVFKNFSQPQHLIGLAPTGTGKTHAYLLAILSQIDVNQAVVQAVIIAPTNELVLQIFKMLQAIPENAVKVRIFYGGMDKKRTSLKLQKQQPQIVIATPEKLFEYAISLGQLKINRTLFFVLDEADMLLDRKFLSFLKPLMITKSKPKIMLFSATFKPFLTNFIKQNFGPTLLIDLTKNYLKNIKYYLLKSHDKLKTLLTLTQKLKPYLALIFVSRKQDQLPIFETLKKHQLNVFNFSSDLSVKQRKQSLKAIENLKYQYIITSDLAARGLDLDISLVIHYDLPLHLEFFQHRSGRTGRMGKPGEVITIYNESEIKTINKLKSQHFNFQQMILTSKEIEILKPKPDRNHKPHLIKTPRKKNKIRSIQKYSQGKKKNA
ncbi:Superfamily II DNA and RNA helicase [Candidatus Phytoplasma mali]|uniref:Superfamily II DNA and RNA helicase n=1 Tax=Phytoplasma mali (strain AT) TaxID=482235 RepID=B3R051_PHYMT|nr:DEAD/DEAH box helicase [Candidatus Phytoplasma mali]CAP18215.1 Superfamily II DNA and RNA helicase [Candidatus Phytoplasma mali]CAP18657.1 Superfamily II DNA and RNA helicase [Candidatus Phytoplasma mali]